MKDENRELFKGKYRIKSFRHPWWDYSSYGYYFVTICTKNRQEFFGKIKNGIMGLSKIGCVATKCWQEIPKHFPHVILDEWIVMPNHVHGILLIDGKNVETQNFVSPQTQDKKQQKFSPNKFGPQSKNLASIIRGFKIGVKKYATENNIDFCWQSLYHDHIIPNEKALNNIRKYIQNNPGMWWRDRNNLF